MGQNPICNKILLRMFLICPFYMTLTSSWVDKVAENAEKCSMEAGPWHDSRARAARRASS